MLSRNFRTITLNKFRLTYQIENKTWYKFLVPKHGRKKSLEGDYGSESLLHSLIISYNSPQYGRIYSLFESYLDFYDYQKLLNKSQYFFYEIIKGELPQKPHFDIDIKSDKIPEGFNLNEIAEEIKDSLIEACCLVLKERGISISLERNILLFNSHGPDKRSFHLVIDGYCHFSNLDAKAFYNEVMKVLPSTLKEKYPSLNQYIDPGVYSSKQQFRLLGSRKGPDALRYKVFENPWSFQGQTINHQYGEEILDEAHQEMVLFSESLVSFTSMSVNLPPFYNAEAEIKKRMKFTSIELDEDTGTKAITMLAGLVNMDPSDSRFPYTVSGIEGGIILLKRRRPSFCKICQRIHEAENPFMFIVNNQVFWHCRRAPVESKLFVGYLNIDQINTVQKPEEQEFLDSISPFLSQQGIINQEFNQINQEGKQNQNIPINQEGKQNQNNLINHEILDNLVNNDKSNQNNPVDDKVNSDESNNQPNSNNINLMPDTQISNIIFTQPNVRQLIKEADDNYVKKYKEKKKIQEDKKFPNFQPIFENLSSNSSAIWLQFSEPQREARGFY